MLKVFYGNDVLAVRKAAFLCVDKELESGKVLTTIDADTYTSGMYQDMAGGASLFGEEQVYVIDTPSSKKDFYEETVADLELLAASPHVFVVIEGTLLAAEKKKFAKHTENLEEFKAGAEGRYDLFAITDALAQKDKKQLWLLLHDAQLEGIPLPELVGMLWWQLKTMRLASATSTPEEAGMKPFPYNKAKRALASFKDGELEKLSHSLLTLVHDSRLGKLELDNALERWVLTV